MLWVKAVKGVCSSWKGQQVWLQIPVLGAWTELASRKRMEEFASFSFTVHPCWEKHWGKILQQDPSNSTLDIWHKVWSRMVPYGSTKLLVLHVPGRHHSALGIHRAEGGQHRAHKGRRCHRGREAGLAQQGCRAAVWKCIALGNECERMDFMYWRGWSGKQRAWRMRYPWKTLLLQVPEVSGGSGLLRAVSGWFLLGCCHQVSIVLPAWTLPELGIPFPEVTSLPY